MFDRILLVLFGTGYLGTGYLVLGTGYWLLGTGYWVPGYWVLGTGYWVPGYLGTWVPGYLGTGYWVPGYLGTWVLGTWVPGNLGTWVPGYWVLGTGYWVLGTLKRELCFIAEKNEALKKAALENNKFPRLLILKNRITNSRLLRGRLTFVILVADCTSLFLKKQ